MLHSFWYDQKLRKQPTWNVTDTCGCTLLICLLSSVCVQWSWYLMSCLSWNSKHHNCRNWFNNDYYNVRNIFTGMTPGLLESGMTPAGLVHGGLTPAGLHHGGMTPGKLYQQPHLLIMFLILSKLQLLLGIWLAWTKIVPDILLRTLTTFRFRQGKL